MIDIAADNKRVKIVLIGSYDKHSHAIFRVREQFLTDGARVLRPDTDEIVSVDGFVRLAGDVDDPELIQQSQLSAIDEADAVYIVNPGGYIGPNGMLAVGYARGRNIAIYAAEEPYEASAKHVVDAVAKPARVVELMRSK